MFNNQINGFIQVKNVSVIQLQVILRGLIKVEEVLLRCISLLSLTYLHLKQVNSQTNNYVTYNMKLASTHSLCGHCITDLGLE